MNSFITNVDFKKIGNDLDTKRHGAMIYENIHMLASNLGVADKLVTPKRDVSNHPATKLWKGYEGAHLYYIKCLLDSWYQKGYKSKVNAENFKKLSKLVEVDTSLPNWITPEVVAVHRSVLYQKDPIHYGKKFTLGYKSLEMRYDWRDNDN